MDQAIQKIKQLLFENEEVKAKLDDLTHVDNFKDFLRSFELIWWLLKRIVVVVEIVQKQFEMLQPDERIDAAAQVLDDLITFKGIFAFLEIFDKSVFKIALSAAVHGLNDLFGNNWMGKISDILSSLGLIIDLDNGNA